MNRISKEHDDDCDMNISSEKNNDVDVAQHQGTEIKDYGSTISHLTNYDRSDDKANRNSCETQDVRSSSTSSSKTQQTAPSSNQRTTTTTSVTTKRSRTTRTYYKYPTETDIVLKNGISSTAAINGCFVDGWSYDSVPSLRQATKEFTKRYQQQEQHDEQKPLLFDWITSKIDIIMEWLHLNCNNPSFFVLHKGIWHALDVKIVAKKYRKEMIEIMELLMRHELTGYSEDINRLEGKNHIDESILQPCQEILPPYHDPHYRNLHHNRYQPQQQPHQIIKKQNQPTMDLHTKQKKYKKTNLKDLTKSHSKTLNSKKKLYLQYQKQGKNPWRNIPPQYQPILPHTMKHPPTNSQLIIPPNKSDTIRQSTSFLSPKQQQEPTNHCFPNQSSVRTTTPHHDSSIERLVSEETPITTNITRKMLIEPTNKTTTYQKGAIDSNQNNTTTMVKDNYSNNSNIDKKQKSNKKEKKVIVGVEDLTYDWSELQLGINTGSAAWNQLLKKHYLYDNPGLYTEIPQVSAIDTLRAMQSLHHSLVMILPPLDSPLHNVVKYPYYHHQQQHQLLSSAVDEQNIPMDLRPIFPRLANEYRKFMAQDFDDGDDDNDSSSINGPSCRNFQYMKSSEIKDYLNFVEQDTKELSNDEKRILQTSQRLGLWKKHHINSKDNTCNIRTCRNVDEVEDELDGTDSKKLPAVTSKNTNTSNSLSHGSTTTLKKQLHDRSCYEPICWQQDFEALLQKRTPNVQFLTIHDQN